MIFSDDDARRERERAAYKYFLDYLEDCEGVYVNCMSDHKNGVGGDSSEREIAGSVLRIADGGTPTISGGAHLRQAGTFSSVSTTLIPLTQFPMCE